MKFIVIKIFSDYKYKQEWKPIVSVVEKIFRNKIQVSEKLNKIL